MGELGDLKQSYDGIISATNVIEKAGDTNSFKEWVTVEHHPEDLDVIFEGYKFFMETAIRNLIHEIVYSRLSLFEEDFVFFRARFKGIPLSKIPNTCRKTNFIKSVNSYRRDLRKATEWDDVQDVFDEFNQDIGEPLFQLFDEYAIVDHDANVEKMELLRCSTIFELFVHFNDVDDGHPNGYYPTLLPSDLREERLEESLRGYIYTLQYVWSNLVSNQQYENSPINQLHKSTKWSISFDGFSDPTHPKERIDLDRFFGDIRDELIYPLQEESDYAILDRAFYLKDDAPIDSFRSLISSDSEVEMSKEEEFEYQLIWYQVELLQASSIFNGVPAFISLLIGRVNLKKRHADGEKTYVCKFTHPVESGNDFSYGVLVEAWGSTGMGDYSGWLLFYDCCGDYSGFAGSEHILAESIIEEYLEKDLIDLREMELPKSEFQNLISDQSVGDMGEQLTEKMELQSERNQLREKVRRARGILLEFIAYYYSSKSVSDANSIDWNIPAGDGEIDVVIEGSDIVRYIECKFDPTTQNLNNQITKLNQKVQDSNQGKPVKGEFWFWIEPNPETTKRLEEHNFDYKVVDRIVQDDPLFHNKDIQHIQYIMEKYS